jgi:hypothetical protein
MGADERRRPADSERVRAEKRAREARLAEAMRQNLRRRKAQARERADKGGSDEDPSGGSSEVDRSSPTG